MASTKRTPEIEAAILCSISEGKSLTSWCKEHKIPTSTVGEWLVNDEALVGRYMHARIMQCDYLAEEILDISDDKDLAPEHKRIMVDARKWYVGKLNQQKYGDKQSIELTGKDGAPLSLRLVEMQQRLLKDITPQMQVIEHKPALDDII